MFLIGEGVFYPLYGAGLVINIEEKEIYNISKKYYIIKLIISNIIVMIPVDAEDSKRIRGIIKDYEYQNIISILKDNFNILPSKWCDRYKIYNATLREGDIFKLTELLRDIHNLPKRKEISKSDIKIFYEILSMIASEICIATRIDFESIKLDLLNALQ